MKVVKRMLSFLVACVIGLSSYGSVSGSLSASKKSGSVNDNYRTYYEVFLSSFYDSNGDGIGDFNGLTKKLDYLNDGHGGGLGVTGIWLMPIMPSPSYHKYDVTDYFNVDPSLGTMSDFKNLVSECHKRGIKLIIDFEANHTSSSHPWFKSAVASIEKNPQNPGDNKYLRYYNFVNGQPSTGNYARVGSTDWYCEDEFGANMPDLNLDNPDVKTELGNSAKFWLGMGVDGFRLDAVLYYYGSNGAGDDDKNISFVNWFTDTCKTVNKDVYIVGEVWSDATTISTYYESRASSFFAFPFSDGTGIIASTLNYSGSDYNAQSFANKMYLWQNMLRDENKSAIDAPFLSNHDQGRAAGYFSKNLAKTKMAAGMYLMMSGNAFIYYGEEIGLTGSAKDEDKRGPMYWSKTDKTGMTLGPVNMDKQSFIYPPEDAQAKDKNSLLNYYKKAVKLRNKYPEIERGVISVIGGIKDKQICAVKKLYNGSKLIIVYNISSSAKTLQLSKSKNGYSSLKDYLSANGKAVTLKGEKLSLPPMSIAILK